MTALSRASLPSAIQTALNQNIPVGNNTQAITGAVLVNAIVTAITPIIQSCFNLNDDTQASVPGLPATLQTIQNSIPSTSGLASQAALTSLANSIPAPASSAPPGVAVASAVGSATAYAKADHTHASSVQRRTLTTTVSGGTSTATWTFTNPYTALPVVTAIAQAASSSAQPYVVEVLSVSTTAVTFQVWQAATTTLGYTLLNIAGTVISPLVAAPANVSLNCWAALPTL